MLGTTVNSLCILIGTSIEVRKMTEESKKRSFNLNADCKIKLNTVPIQ